MTPVAHFNAWRIVSLSPLPHWAIWVVGLGLLAAFAWTTRSVWAERRPLRCLALLSLRAVSALSLLALLFEPGLQRRQTAKVKSRFLLLLDQSRSMALPAGVAAAPENSRSQAVERWAGEHRLDLSQLAERFEVEVQAFAGELQPLSFASLFQASPPLGAHTDLLRALQAAGEHRSGQRPLAGALVISDGADNVELQHGVSVAQAAALRALAVPLNTLAVGQGGLKDLAVANLQVDDFAFVRNPLTLEVSLRSEGFGRDSVPITLTRAGRVVASQTVTLDPSGLTKARLSFTPDQTGEFVFTVSVPLFPDEAVADNNRRAFVLKVIRDRVRVLLVCGHPSWDERFLRGLLRQDPNVDLVSFFILRGTHDNPHANEDELSLIPFPTEEIFRTQLHSFDLVILQDFAYRPFSTGFASLRIESYFPDIKRYVQEGGALLMIGGENSFGEGQYDQTELADVLPVAGAGLPPLDQVFHPQLTDEGRRHPVAQLAENPDQSARLWAALPPVRSINLVRAKPGTRVLLSHPLFSVEGANAPVLAVADEGRGRSMALMTDDAWRWAFEPGAEGQKSNGSNASGTGAIANRSYEQFFTNAVRWLVRDPDLTPVKLSTPQRSLEPGQPAIFDVRARQADYGPAAGAAVTLTLFDAETDRAVKEVRATAGRDGATRVEIPALPAGAYRAVAVASFEGSGEGSGARVELGRAEQALAVRENGPETEDPLPHPELLAQIAAASGGVASSLRDGFPKLKTVHESEEVEIGRRQEQPLWDNPIPLAILAVALATEWLLRRRWGFA